MTKINELKSLIVNILSDEQTHTAQEIRLIAAQNGILSTSSSKDSSVRGAIHQLKEENPNIHTITRGVYIMTSSEVNTLNSIHECSLDDSLAHIQNCLQNIKNYDWIHSPYSKASSQVFISITFSPLISHFIELTIST